MASCWVLSLSAFGQAASTADVIDKIANVVKNFIFISYLFVLADF
jgi:hypothetical protein